MPSLAPEQQQVLISWWVFACATAMALILVPIAKAVAWRFGIVDQPGKFRKLHDTDMPLLGGLAIYCAIGGTVALNWALLRPASAFPAIAATFPDPIILAAGMNEVRDQLFGFGIGATIILLIGLLDDVYGVEFPVIAKLIGQVAAAAIFMHTGVRTSLFPGALPGDIHNIIITLLWIVGFTNAFNLLDNMDGLCSGVALIASSILAFIAIQSGQFFLSLLLCAFSGALLGFFRYNSSPSQIFLGDAGSLLIGYTMAAVVLLESFVTYGNGSLLGVLMPVVILSLPLFDTVSVIIIRIRDGRPIHRGDRSHLSHRLVDLGLRRDQAVQVLYLLTFCLGINATLLAGCTTIEALTVGIQGLGIVCLVAVLMNLGGDRVSDRTPDENAGTAEADGVARSSSPTDE